MEILELKNNIINAFRNGEIVPEYNCRLIEMVHLEDESVQKEIAQEFLREEGANMLVNIWLYSFSLAVYPDASVLKNLIYMLQLTSALLWEQKYFLYQQIHFIIETKSGCDTESNEQLVQQLLESIQQECLKEWKLPFVRIPDSETNNGIAVVLVEQFFSEDDERTKTALEQCWQLKHVYGKDVMLINTAEFLTPANAVYFENAEISGYQEELSGTNEITWRDETFRFYQCAQRMPEKDSMLELVSFIQAIKPGTLIQVGTSSLLAKLLHLIIPITTVNVPSSEAGLQMGVSETAKPIVSVIVPCYNVEAYVARCLDSILHQTIGIENLEVIVVNDASTDNTLAVLQKYQADYPDTIRLIDRKENSGPGKARNAGMQIATADCLSFIDADDWISHEMYEDLYKNGIAQGCDLAMCGIDRPTRFEETPLTGNSGCIDVRSDAMRKRFLAEYRTDVSPCNKLYKKSLFTDYGIQYVEGLCYEDNYTGFLAILLSEQVYVTEKNYYHWFVDQTSITSTHKESMDRITVQDMLMQKIKELGLYARFKDEIEFHYMDKIFGECLAILHMTKKLTKESVLELKERVLRQIPDIVKNPYYLGEREITKISLTEKSKPLIFGDVTEEKIKEIFG